MKHASRGFTLIELMTAVTVMGVLFALAIPSYREFTRNNRTAATQNELVTAFTYARSEALRRGTPVAVCASTDGTTCSGSANWASGWIAFVDSGATAGSVDTGDPAEIVLQTWGAANGDMTISGGTATYLQYGATGTSSPATTPATFTVYPTGCTGAHMRQVGVSVVGSLTSTTQDCP